MHVIGTAGHVDHGKSTLIEALTGIHPDRLKEEREREMTIDLGFAWITLPGGEELGIIDVPGHRDFIENMLAGVGGIDAALFVVAADEGVMPQTREHLAILDLLQIQGGVVALTKIDMVQDSGWLDLVEEDLRSVLTGTVLEGAPIVRVSARKKIGLSELQEALSASLAERPQRPDLNRPRLPIDRVFTVAGFGTVVTGTLTEGVLNVGDELEILPRGLRGRVRGLQTHQRKVDRAVPGSRTAVNISGVNVDQIQRGDVVAHPGQFKPTRRVDVKFRHLADASQPLRHNTEAKLFIGSTEVIARVRLLGAEQLHPGEEGWLQLEPREPIIALRGDRYILRRPSPGETLGGGVVVDPRPRRRHKRFSELVLERLSALAQGTPGEVLLQSLLALGAARLDEAIARSSLDSTPAAQAVAELTENGQLVILEGESETNQPAGGQALVTSQAYWRQLAGRAVDEIERYQAENPLRLGMPREELKSRLRLAPRLFNAVIKRLAQQGDVEETGPLVHRPGHAIRFKAEQEKAIEVLLARFAQSPYTPPTVKESQAAVGEQVYRALLDLDRLVEVSQEVVFRKEDYAEMVVQIRRLLEEKGELSAAAVRDHFNTSRRYALALLEHLDAEGITLRVGDVRRLRGSR